MCDNKLFVSGSGLQAFVTENFNEDGSLDFSMSVPPPNDLSGEELLNWRASEWGTKWNAGNCLARLVDRTLVVTFETAWAAPIAWLSTVAEKYKTLHNGIEATSEIDGQSRRIL